MATGFGPTDHFGLAGNFHPQRSRALTEETTAHALDSVGNVEVEGGGINTTTRYEVDYVYCNPDPDIVTDLGTVLTSFGGVRSGVVVDEVVVRFEEGQYAGVSVAGHQHAENAHAAGFVVSDVSAALPADAGFGVPVFSGQVMGDDCAPLEMEVEFSCNHLDAEGAYGDHFAGTAITFRCDLSEEFRGIPDTAAATGYTTESVSAAAGDDSNDDFDQATYTAHRFFDAT